MGESRKVLVVSGAEAGARPNPGVIRCQLGASWFLSPRVFYQGLPPSHCPHHLTISLSR
ncbi:hypothetical protein J6590_076332 [Homalodisca vitripennis]|nr:hypothetical protein J6590_076332 [Homalodisca vitripennis]